MISYWFDINILSEIKLHVSQNVVLFLQNIKKWQKKAISAQLDAAIFCMTNILMKICHKIDLQIIAMCVYFSKILLHLKKLLQTIFRGYFMVFFTLIINIEGKYHVFVHFWHQTFIDLVRAISIFTLDMSVNNISNSSIFHIRPFHNGELG